jgi:acyl-CoA synthetase (AMP-forming)/AMP-acid ligase II
MDTAPAETLIDSLRNTVAAYPTRTAFTFEGRSTDFQNFARHTDQVAAALHAAGVKPGERVAYIGKNSDLFFEAFYGAVKAGAVIAPVNWRLAGPEISVIVADTHAQLIFVGPEFHGVVEAELPNMPEVRTIIAMEGGHAVWPDFAAWRDGQAAEAPQVTVTAQDAAIQLYTSGTTGRPKGVMLSHHNFMHDANNKDGAAWTQWRDGDAAIQAMPVSHISGSGWGILTVHHAAACHVQRQFDIDMTIDMILNDRISKIFLVPAAMQVLVRHPRAKNADFSCIREMGYGASPIPLALLRECMDVMGCGFVQFYGMTETTGTIVALPPEDHSPEGSPRMRAAGKPLPFVELRVVDAEGRDLPLGQVGEIVTRSPANMLGYWNRPEETARTLRDGWLHTGDAGFLDEDGYVYIHDRVKDMIISGGENVYPAEVESALSDHPAIAEVGRSGEGDGRAAARCRTDRGGADRVGAHAYRRVQDAAQRGFRPDATAQCLRQAAEAGVAGALLGRAGAAGELT